MMRVVESDFKQMLDSIEAALQSLEQYYKKRSDKQTIHELITIYKDDRGDVNIGDLNDELINFMESTSEEYLKFVSIL